MTRHFVVGIGEVGGAILANLNDVLDMAWVAGFDLEDFASSRYAREAQSHWLHICIPFSTSENFIANVLKWLTPKTKLIVVHSTTEPGTTKNLGMAACIPVIHSPVNGKHVSSRTMETYIRTLPKFFAGDRSVEKQVTRELRGVWDVCWLDADPAVTETMKLLATTYYALLINWTQFVHRLCRERGLPYGKIMSVFNLIDSEDWRIDNKYPGKWGGHCIEPNLKLLMDSYPGESLLHAMKALNEEHED